MYYFVASVNFFTELYHLGICQIQIETSPEAMSHLNPYMIFTDGESTSKPSKAAVIENSPSTRPAMGGLEKDDGIQTSGLEDHSPGFLTRQPASKSMELLDQTNLVTFQTEPGPRYSNAKIDIPILKNSLIAAEQREPLKETKIYVDRISELEKSSSQETPL